MEERGGIRRRENECRRGRMTLWWGWWWRLEEEEEEEEGADLSQK